MVGSFGDCPRCLAVCPVGNDYHAHLADIQKHIPEKTPEKVAKAAELQAGAAEGRPRPAGPVRVERPLGRREGLPGNRREAAAGVQAAAEGEGRGGEAVNIFKRKLTARDVKDKARELGADLVGIADGENVDASNITDHDGGRVIVLATRVQAGSSRILHVERPQQVLQRRALAHLPRGGVARAGVLAGGRGLPGDHHAADPRRSLALRRRPEEAPQTLISLPHAAVEAGLGTLGLNVQLLTPRIRPARHADRRAVLGRRRVRPADDRGAVPRAAVRALPQGLPRRRRRPLGARLGGLRPLPLAARLRAALRVPRHA